MKLKIQDIFATLRFQVISIYALLQLTQIFVSLDQANIRFLGSYQINTNTMHRSHIILILQDAYNSDQNWEYTIFTWHLHQI